MSHEQKVVQYVTELDRQFQTGSAREHTYRPALQRLLSEILPHLIVSNEPARLPCGQIDFALSRKKDNFPIAFIETKNLNDSDIAGNNKNKEQFDRYKRYLDHIIFTDYLEFLRYEKETGEIESIRIAELKGGKIKPLKENFDRFKSFIEHFGQAKPQTITSSAKLAKIMADKARLMAEVIEKILKNDSEDSPLSRLMADFREILIHDITREQFSDVYAQTIVYGMFSARRYCITPNKFSREMVTELIPKSNPFLHELFDHIARRNLDEDIHWIVDDLVESFRATDIDAVMTNFGEHTQQSNPIIHFYENFLTEYDPIERAERGVWYTPPAVVHFIVHAVDEILQNDFNLPLGLADSSQVENKRAEKTKNEKVHKVQILDPTVGTGTFLVETAKQIRDKVPHGVWSSYVKEHLIPRLNGFEVLMAPYIIAHINLSRFLEQPGYRAEHEQRFRIFLTNSLKDTSAETQRRLSFFLDQEAAEADRVKGNMPIMVVMGNPPYRGITANKGLGNIEEYKYVDGEHFGERKHSLNDDYVKFIRLGQVFVDKNGEGILAYISNHKFIENPTFRGMRQNLMRSFDKIYILDLHGDSKIEKGVCPDGSKDENVFDIQQGVSINIFIKTGRKSKDAMAKIYHYDLYGKRQEKYNFLSNTKFSDVPFALVKPITPYYFLKPRNESNLTEYEQGFRVDELIPLNSFGFLTANDPLNISFTEHEQEEKINDLLTMEESEWREKYNRPRDSRDWTFSTAKQDANKYKQNICSVSYRPFDTRYTCYSGMSRGLYASPQKKIMQQFLNGENTGLCIMRIGRDYNYSIFVTNKMTDKTVLSPKDNASVFPLYLYPNEATLQNVARTPNLDLKIVEKIAQAINLKFEIEKSGKPKTFAPIDILDYIYAVLHCPSYRERYKEFLKIDFPRVPYPDDAKTFWKQVKLGEKLRRLHLMEEVHPQKRLANYDVDGNNVVEKFEYTSGKVWINATQYFDKVPDSVWNFYIGGYQPAQKWLKDRKGRTLTFDDIQHYQKIVAVLKETEKLMGEVDKCDLDYKEGLR